MHQELNHGSKVRAAVGIRGCRFTEIIDCSFPCCVICPSIKALLIWEILLKKTISSGKKQHDISNSSYFLEGSCFYVIFPTIVQLIRKHLHSFCHYYWHVAFLIDYILSHFPVQNKAWVINKV